MNTIIGLIHILVVLVTIVMRIQLGVISESWIGLLCGILMIEAIAHFEGRK